MQLSRGGALGAPPASAPFKAAAGTTNNLVWWAVVDFLAELPQAGFPCSGEVFASGRLAVGARVGPRQDLVRRKGGPLGAAVSVECK